MDLRSFTNHVVFSTPLGLTCCICVIHDLHSSALPHILHLLFSWVLSIFAFMLLVLLACSCAAIIKASVVLFKHPFLSHHHPSSLVLSVVFLMNCPCNCFCVQCIFPSFFFLFLYILFPLFVLIWCFSIFIVFCCMCSLSLLFLT